MTPYLCRHFKSLFFRPVVKSSSASTPEALSETLRRALTCHHPSSAPGPARPQFFSTIVPTAAEMTTRIVKVDTGAELGRFDQHGERLGQWHVSNEPNAQASISALQEAANALRNTDIPVAFPTETVYGLGADATRTSAVKGIYKAKARPSDNPLIIHVPDLAMLRDYLRPAQVNGAQTNGTLSEESDPIPQIYKPLIDRFWPGPLTILMPNPVPSKLAPEVTAGLKTFGVRMPSTPLALTLIQLAGVPLAAPSANASTKPSPTAAQHVLEDLDGRIELILDGGACSVGVESTVVDGLCDPPVVLRPGGVSLEELRSCPGWEGAVKGYKDASEEGNTFAPRAPGMKYKHYSPKATVVLYEATCGAGKDGIVEEDLLQRVSVLPGQAAVADGQLKKVGVIRTRRWRTTGGLREGRVRVPSANTDVVQETIGSESLLFEIRRGELAGDDGRPAAAILDIDLGQDIRGIAQGLFSALRELDRRGADLILVDGVGDADDIAAAVMNRLRKAASEIRS